MTGDANEPHHGSQPPPESAAVEAIWRATIGSTAPSPPGPQAQHAQAAQPTPLSAAAAGFEAVRLDIANALREIARLEVFRSLAGTPGDDGNGRFRSRAFTYAAQRIEDWPPDTPPTPAALESAGLGPSTLEVIFEIVQTGDARRRQELRARFPRAAQLMATTGVGPAKAQAILAGQAPPPTAPAAGGLSKRRLTLSDAQLIAGDLIAGVHHSIGTGVWVVPCGSLRRRRRMIGDLDLLCFGVTAPVLADYMRRIGADLGSAGAGRVDCQWRGVQCNLPICDDPGAWGAALIHWTGGREFNIGLRRRAKQLGYLLNDKGLYGGVTYQRLPDTGTEAGIFAALRVPYVDPTQRNGKLYEKRMPR
jgi:DNA polymerase (family 10)